MFHLPQLSERLPRRSSPPILMTNILLRTCLQSFTRTDWAAAQLRGTLCAATRRFHSLVLPTSPTTHHIDHDLSAFANGILPPFEHATSPSSKANTPDMLDVIILARKTQTIRSGRLHHSSRQANQSCARLWSHQISRPRLPDGCSRARLLSPRVCSALQALPGSVRQHRHPNLPAGGSLHIRYSGGRLGLHISGHQPVRSRRGFLARLYEIHWVDVLNPSWEREANLER